ncbi:hypothetical protein ACFL54_04890 [Planctomycetota bacterium]
MTTSTRAKIFGLFTLLTGFMLFSAQNLKSSDWGEDSSFVKRRADAPIDWKKVELIVVQSHHDNFRTELRKRNYPYWYLTQKQFVSYLDYGGANKVAFFSEKGKSSKGVVRYDPKRQVILFGCSDYILLTLKQIYKLRNYVADGGFIFNNCWGVTMLGQVFPDYLKVALDNDYPEEDIKTDQGNKDLPCNLKVSKKSHSLFIGLEKMDDTITFTFSGARRAKLVHKDIETLFYIPAEKDAAMFWFQFKEDPDKLSEKQIEVISGRQRKKPKRGKPRGAASGQDVEPWALKSYAGRCLNFLPHFVEQADSNRKVADIRDTIFYNFIVVKQDTYDEYIKKNPGEKEKGKKKKGKK